MHLHTHYKYSLIKFSYGYEVLCLAKTFERLLANLANLVFELAEKRNVRLMCFQNLFVYDYLENKHIQRNLITNTITEYLSP